VSKRSYEYFHCRKVGASASGKTEVWHLLSNSSETLLGVVKWYGAWRQYCFFPESETLFSRGCLGDIQSFLKLLMEAHVK
jgi:hypothetical protein